MLRGARTIGGVITSSRCSSPSSFSGSIRWTFLCYPADAVGDRLLCAQKISLHKFGVKVLISQNWLNWLSKLDQSEGKVIRWVKIAEHTRSLFFHIAYRRDWEVRKIKMKAAEVLISWFFCFNLFFFNPLCGSSSQNAASYIFHHATNRLSSSDPSWFGKCLPLSNSMQAVCNADTLFFVPLLPGTQTTFITKPVALPQTFSFLGV